MAVSEETFDGLQKASILMVTLGAAASAEVFKHLSPEEVEKLSSGLVQLNDVDPDQKAAVLEEFQQSSSSEAADGGGIDFARQVLEQALGEEQGSQVINKVSTNPKSAGKGKPFEWLRKRQPDQVVKLIESESPQTLALILAHLPADLAGAALEALAPEAQSEVARRIARLELANPEVVRQVETALHERLSAVPAEQVVVAGGGGGGAKVLVDILTNMPRSAEKAIMSVLEEQDADLAKEITDLIFVFEDIVILDDRAIQLALRDLDQEDLRIAMKGADEPVKEAVFRNMSERAVESLKEDLELAGPVKIRDVEAAQQRIVLAIRALEEKGEITIDKSGGASEDQTEEQSAEQAQAQSEEQPQDQAAEQSEEKPGE